MKKIVSFLLVLACVLGLASCAKTETKSFSLDDVKAMFENSDPYRVDVTSTQSIEGLPDLHGTSTLVRGTIDGVAATVYTSTYQKIAAVEDQSKDPIVTVNESREYVESRGIRVNGGKWDPTGVDFTPEAGGFTLNFSASAIPNFKYENHTLTFTVAAAKAAAVFGADSGIESEVEVKIADDGAKIVSMELSYTAEVEVDGEAVDADVVLYAVYSYDLQTVTLVK